MEITFSENLLRDIYDGPLTPLWREISACAYGEADQITTRFYQRLISNDEAVALFDESELAERHESFVEWTRALFVPERSGLELERFLDWQSHVGKVHVRRSIPLRFVNLAGRILKDEICQVLKAGKMEREMLAEAVLLTGLVVDEALMMMTDTYVEDSNDLSIQMGHRNALATSIAADQDLELELEPDPDSSSS